MKRQARKNKIRLASTLAVILFFFIFAGKLFLDAIYVPVIIMYHSVGERCVTLGTPDSKLNVLPGVFAKQMGFLNDHNYKVIPLTEFIDRIRDGKKIPPKTIAITLDDGIRNNFLNAYPILKKYNFPATMFIIVDFIGKQDFLTLDDIKTMQEAGNISIGSHTLSHSHLPSLDEESLRKELFDSKKILEEMTGREIEVLCYPMGEFNEKVKKMAKEAGYIGALTTNPGRKHPKDDIYALKRTRISMTAANLFVFRIKTSGYYTFIKEIGRKNPASPARLTAKPWAGRQK